MKKLTTILAFAGTMAAVGAVTESIEDRVVTLSGTGEWTKSYSAEEVDRVVFPKNANVTWTPATPSTYTGGTSFSGSLLYLGANGALGTGDLAMNEGALSVKSGADIVIPNKVIFPQNNIYGYACAMDGNGSITLQSVGTPASGSTHHLRLGRAAAASAGTATLSLTQENSEAVDQIVLAGKVDVTLNDGTVKMRSDAKSPFFSKYWSNTAPTVTVAKDGITFDVPSDTSVTLGETLQFAYETYMQVKETYLTTNWSFEDGGLAGWTIINETEGGSGVFTNGEPYDGKGLYPTTNGTHYVMVRRGGKLQQTINLPTSGKWRVVLERGCRDGAYSKDMQSWVKIGDTKVMDMPELSSLDSPEGFTQYVSSVIDLTAGEDYLLSIELEAITSGNRSFNFDAIRLERMEVVTNSISFIKTGAGSLNTGNAVLSQLDILLNAGTLKTSPESLRGSNVYVKNGATLCLDGATLDADTMVKVAAGGTLKFTGTMDNLLANASFESGYTDNYVSGAVAGWTASGTWYGITRSDAGTLGSGLTSSGCGAQALFLRDASQIEQAVNVPAAGDYLISFLEAPRQYLSPHTLPIVVKIDGTEVFRVGARATKEKAYVRHSTTVALTAGSHTFTLATENGTGTGNDLLLDDVALRPTAKTDIGGRLALSTGSTLIFDNAEPIRWRNVMLNGEYVNGGKAALADGGVTVQGSGKFSAGDPQGLILIVQ